MTKIPKLFELMNQKNITAKQLSADLKISAGNISDWKSGRSMPSSEKLQLIADYFNVSTKYLLGNDNIKVYDEHDNIVVIDDETRDIIDCLRTKAQMKILNVLAKNANISLNVLGNKKRER